MVSPEAWPDFYLAYVKVPPASSGSSSAASRDSTQCAAEGAAFSSDSFFWRECSSCGVPLTVFRKYVALQLQEDMTAHLCITTYKSPDNEVLKLEVGGAQDALRTGSNW